MVYKGDLLKNIYSITNVKNILKRKLEMCILLSAKKIKLQGNEIAQKNKSELIKTSHVLRIYNA